MKRLFLILIIALLATTFATNNSMAQNRRNEETVKLKVNMDCNMCVQKIESNIPYVRGVRDLKVSLEKGECEVTYRTNRTSVEEIIEAFEKLDFTATVKCDDEDGSEGKA